MAHDPLNVLWVEPTFPGRLGSVADWLVRRRGYRSWFYCHTCDSRESWPASAGQGLDVQTFGVGGVARESAVTWSRALERSLCYAYGCWEVLDQKRPRPIDLIVGRSAGLGSCLFAPVYWPAAPVINFLDYYYHAHHNDLAGEAGPETPPAYFHWRRSMAAIELLDLEQTSLGWTPTEWQRRLFPAEYRDQFLVLHDGIDTNRFAHSAWHARGTGPRSIAGRVIPDSTRVVSFIARSLDRLRGFDRFLAVAEAVLRARRDVLIIVAGDPIVRRGLDVAFHNKDYPAQLLAGRPPVDRDRLWFLGPVSPSTVAEVLAGSDLHIAPGRPYPVARSLLEAMAAGCVVLASDTEPHREVITPGQTGLLAGGHDTEALARQALAVLADPEAARPLGTAAAALVRQRYSQDVCLPRLAEQLSELVGAGWHKNRDRPPGKGIPGP
jgi:glycosyltransferase involved in cell wall biosynthesis